MITLINIHYLHILHLNENWYLRRQKDKLLKIETSKQN